jgi:hypothetical protein
MGFRIYPQIYPHLNAARALWPHNDAGFAEIGRLRSTVGNAESPIDILKSSQEATKKRDR